MKVDVQHIIYAVSDILEIYTHHINLKKDTSLTNLLD